MPCGGPKKSPRTSSIVQVIFSFWSFEISEDILRDQKFIIGYDSFSYQCLLLYLINIHWLSVDFDWSRAGHAEGAILSCRMIILPSDVMSDLKSAGALVVTCVCLQCTWRVLFCHVA